MKKKEKSSYSQYGLIGKKITYSFSPSYFKKKFSQLNIAAQYDIFDLNNIQDLEKVFNQKNIKGLNVTIPYKESVIPFLDEISDDAKTIGAVNTIAFQNEKKIGHNTDWIGFYKSIKPLLKSSDYQALILGSGGANKAVQFALNKLQIPFQVISRKPSNGDLIYEDLNQNIIQSHNIIINTTPLGTYPNVEDSPMIPYQFITSQHIVYDLIYNPSTTTFMKKAQKQGATTHNGLNMLEIQADAAWEIWNQ